MLVIGHYCQAGYCSLEVHQIVEGMQSTVTTADCRNPATGDLQVSKTTVDLNTEQ